MFLLNLINYYLMIIPLITLQFLKKPRKKQKKTKVITDCSSVSRKDTTVKFGYSEKATKFEKNFYLRFDVTE